MSNNNSFEIKPYAGTFMVDVGVGDKAVEQKVVINTFQVFWGDQMITSGDEKWCRDYVQLMEKNKPGQYLYTNAKDLPASYNPVKAANG